MLRTSLRFGVYRWGWNPTNQPADTHPIRMRIGEVEADNFVAAHPIATAIFGKECHTDQYLYLKAVADENAIKDTVLLAINQFLLFPPPDSVLESSVWRPGGGQDRWTPYESCGPEEIDMTQNWELLDIGADDSMTIFRYDGPIRHFEEYRWARVLRPSRTTLQSI